MDGYEASTYGDRFADVYDDWYADVSDVEATVELVAALVDRAGGGPVLELGGGSGRLAVPLATRGLDTWTVDASAAMLDRLRGKPGGERVRTIVGDMSQPPFATAVPRFAVVLCAFNTLFNLATTAAQRRCLQRVAGILAAGGHLVVEAFVPPPSDERDSAVGAVELRHIGLDEVVLSVSRVDPATRTVTGQHVQITERGIRLRPWVLHYATPDELDALAAESGLRLVERHGGWRGEPFTGDSPIHVSTYARSRGV
jgi:SAM-dependent methyltransferase